MTKTDRKVRIFCPRCKKKGPARNGPLKRRGRWIWVNTCSKCGAEYSAPSAEPPQQRALERAGQGRLFP